MAASLPVGGRFLVLASTSSDPRVYSSPDPRVYSSPAPHFYSSPDPSPFIAF